MKILTLEPRSPEWHEIRNDSWTASMAAVLVAKPNAMLLKDYAAAKGVELDIEPLLDVGIESFFDHTLWTLWATKNGRIPRFKGNAHTERGTENEEFVVKEFEKKHLVVVQREVTATAEDMSWLLASFDALVPASFDPTVLAPNGFPLEAKVPAFPSRKKLWDSRKAGKLAVMGLPYYWCQVQHQIYVAEAPYGWFAAVGAELDPATGEYKPTFPIMEKIPRDDRFLTAYMAAAKFYYTEFIEKFEEPPRLPQDDALLVRLAENAELDKALASGEHELAAELYLEALQEEAALIQRRKELEEKIVAAARAMRSEGSDVVLLADRVSISFKESTTMSWQKAAKELAKLLGDKDVPKEVIDKCTSKPKETVKVKEV